MNKLSLGVVSGVFAAVMMATPAFAWHFSVSGSGQCQPDGSYKITWVVDNSDQSTGHDNLILTYSSNPQVVKSNAVIPHKVVSYTQTVDGTKPGTYSLKLTGYWQHDHNPFTPATSTVKLRTACEQPKPPVDNPPVDNPPVDNPPVVTPPVTGGMGGGDTTPTAPVAAPVVAPVVTPQVVTPVGAVNAGNGGAPKSASLASIAGLIGSVSAFGLGIRGFKKQA